MTAKKPYTGGGESVNKLAVGVLAFVCCLMLLAGVLVALFSLMDAVSAAAENAWRAMLALPLLAAGVRLYVLLDRICDKRF